jgi:hypothetical protein
MVWKIDNLENRDMPGSVKTSIVEVQKGKYL